MSTAVLERPVSVQPQSKAVAEPSSTSFLNELLDAGKFALYHLEKAKLALAENDLVKAQYQLKASFAHDRLPEAVALKAELKARTAR